MKERDGFILHQRYEKPLLSLPPDEGMKVIKALFLHFRGEEIDFELGEGASMLYGLMEYQLDADARAHEKVCEKRRENALKRWNNANASNSMQMDANASNSMQMHTSASDEKVVFTQHKFLMKNGQEFRITEKWLADLKEAFPKVPIESELTKASMWCMNPANKDKLKTEMMMPQFIIAWMKRYRADDNESNKKDSKKDNFMKSNYDIDEIEKKLLSSH